ncbi:MAG: hypothetical protein ACLQUY_03220 [Ktedonobacterales bacterium]
MGKLIEKLQQVGQTTTSRLGFMGRAAASARKPRPAAVFVMQTAGDVASAEAVAKAGVDGILISGWVPNADISRLKAALESSATLWGVEYTGGPAAESALHAAADAGAGFMLVRPTTPAATVFDEVEHIDLVVTVETPRDDLGLLLLRAENVLPAQAALVPLPQDSKPLDKLTISEFVRLRWVFETLRFPALVMVNEAPEADTVKALVRLGADGIILSGAGSKPETLANKVQALIEVLEAIPVQRPRRSSVTIGGFSVGAVESVTPSRPGRPAPEPDEE